MGGMAGQAGGAGTPAQGGASGGRPADAGRGGISAGASGSGAAAGSGAGASGAAGGSGAGTSGGGGASGGRANDGGTPAGGMLGVAGDDASAGSAGEGTEPPLLVPESGALLGLYYGDESIAATTTKLGRALPLHLTYYAWEDDFTRAETTKDLAAGRIPFVNWELFGGALDDILSGMYDDMLAERAGAAKALGKPFFVDFGAEMNGDWSPWGGAQNGESPTKYVAVYRKVHDIFAAAGATNVIWVFCPNVTDEPRESWNEALGYYPGDDYVDWIGVDGYNWGDTNGGGWQSFAQVFEDIYPKLVTKNKPILIGEMASAESGGDKAAWIDAIIPTLEAEYPAIRALLWFDVNKETDWRVSSSDAAEAAFVRMANDPYFNP